MAEINFRVDGMHCGACVRRVAQALQTVAGTEVEEVRLGAARVKGDPRNSGPMIAALGKAGFTATLES